MRIRLPIPLAVAAATLGMPADSRSADDAPPAPDSPPRPNVVLLVANDLGYADLGFQPDARHEVRTPGIDRLAALGTFFTSAYAAAPTGPPARAALLTGRHPHRWAATGSGHAGFPPSETTLAEILHSHGYATALIGQWHVDGDGGTGTDADARAGHPMDHGYDSFFGFLGGAWDPTRLDARDAAAYDARGRNAARAARVGPLVRGRDERVSFDDDYLTDVLAREAAAFIRNRAGDRRPFLLHVAFQAVGHPTYIGKREYLDWFGVPQPAWDRAAAAWPFPYWDPAAEPDRSRWEAQWEQLGRVDPLGRRRTLASLHGLDLAVAAILAALEDTAILGDTLVVFLSDNGGAIETYADNSPLRGFRSMFGEGGLRIPLVIARPGPLVGGRRLDAMVSAMDVVPTVLDLAGIPAPDDLDGRSLTPLLHGESTRSPHDHLAWSDGHSTRVVRQGDWKWIDSPGWEHAAFSLDARGRALPAPPARYPAGPRLIDLRTDPGESRNLAPDHPDRAAAMEALHAAWLARVRGEASPPVPAGTPSANSSAPRH